MHVFQSTEKCYRGRASIMVNIVGLKYNSKILELKICSRVCAFCVVQDANSEVDLKCGSNHVTNKIVLVKSLIHILLNLFLPHHVCDTYNLVLFN